ncbi:MAG: hypothetical protein ACK55X_00495 [Synechococcaceae cyanobacterium]
MRSALLLGAGLAAFVALAAPARAADAEPCQDITTPAPAKLAPCPSAPCLWTPQAPCAH